MAGVNDVRREHPAALQPPEGHELCRLRVGITTNLSGAQGLCRNFFNFRTGPHLTCTNAS